MSFIDQQFPEQYAYGAIASDEWQTEIIESLSRVEVRNSPSAEPRRAWDLSTTPRTHAQRAELHEWFLAMRGQLHTFAFNDPADNVCDRQSIGTGTGARTTFQIYKTYAVGSASYNRNITKPVTGTTRVWVNGVEQMSGWSVARTTGIITFSAAPANGHTVEASCEFDVPVRFAQPRLAWAAVSHNPTDGVLWECSELSLVEVLGE